MEQKFTFKRLLSLIVVATMLFSTFAMLAVPAGAEDLFWAEGDYTIADNGNYSATHAYGYVFDIAGVDAAPAESNTIFTSDETWKTTNGWAVSVVLELIEGDVYEVVAVYNAPQLSGDWKNSVEALTEGQIVLMAHSSASYPLYNTDEDGNPTTLKATNWQDKVAAVALANTIGARVTLAGIDLENKTIENATVTVQDAPIVVTGENGKWQSDAGTFGFTYDYYTAEDDLVVIVTLDGELVAANAEDTTGNGKATNVRLWVNYGAEKWDRLYDGYIKGDAAALYSKNSEGTEGTEGTVALNEKTFTFTLPLAELAGGNDEFQFTVCVSNTTAYNEGNACLYAPCDTFAWSAWDATNSHTVTLPAEEGGEEGGEEGDEPVVDEHHDILVSHVNAYTWGVFNAMVITGEGQNSVTKLGYNCEWWYAIKVDNVDGLLTVTAIEAPSAEAKANTASADGFILYVYSNDAASYAAAGLVEVGDVLLDCDFDWTKNAASETAIGTMCFGPKPVIDEGLTIEIDDTLVGWIGDAADLDTIEAGLTDGNWGAGDASDWTNASGIYPFQNKVPTDGTQHPEVTLLYNFGEATDVNVINLGVYSSYNVMIGYPATAITVYTSNNGLVWSDGIAAELDLDAPALGNEGSVKAVAYLPEAVNAQYVKVVLTFPDSPFEDKVVWEFMGLTEVEITYEESYKEGLTVEIDDTLVGWIGDAADLETIEGGLTDGNWGAGDASDWTNASGIYPFQNKVPTDGTQHPEVNLIYNFGEATDINTINLGVYSSYNVMIGYPSNLITVYTSSNGFDWSEGTEAYLTLDAPALGKEGSVKTTLHLAEVLNAQYVKVVLTFPDSPFEDKVVWEFMGLTEVEITYEESYKEGLTVEIDDTLVGWIGDAADLETIEGGLTDGNWGAGDANDWTNASGIYPFQNKVPTDGTQHPEVNLVYNFGEATDVNTVKLGVYSSYNVMIGYPSNLITVYTSSNGFDWSEGTEAYLTLDAPALGKEGSVTTTLTLAETLNAQYVKVVLTFPDSPFEDKVVWEFMGLTEIELDYIPITSNVVTDWNPTGYKASYGGATGAFIYDDADIYAACGNDWWIHVAFAPVADMDGYYEVIAVRAPTTGNYLTIPENGFVWMAWSSAGDTPESAGAYALNFMSNLKVGDIVNFVGVDFANHTTETDAYAEVWVDPNAPVNVALNKDYTISGTEDATYNANLTDGNAYGGMSYDNKWFVFNTGSTVDGIGTAIIDLAGDYVISKVQVNLINESGSGVAKPEYVKFYVSADNETWTDLGEVALQDVQSAAYWTGIEDLDVTARYVKLEMKIGAPFSFLNEIEVYGKAAPVKVELVEGENNITVPALNSAIANTNFDSDYVITIEGQWDVTVVVNGVEYYPNRMGVLEAPLPAGENTVEFKNSAEEEAAIVAVVAAPIVGDTMDDPISIEQDGDYVADVTDKHAQGVFYEYVATEDGTVTITITTESGWQYSINNITAGKYGDMHWSDDETVVATETIEVTAGDVIQFVVSTYDPENPWSAPVGTVNFTLDVPGEAAPETVDVALGDINMDGAVDQYDYILVRRQYFETIELNEVQLELADVNSDDKVDQYDYILVCRHYFETFVIEGTVAVPVEALPAE